MTRKNKIIIWSALVALIMVALIGIIVYLSLISRQAIKELGPPEDTSTIPETTDGLKEESLKEKVDFEKLVEKIDTSQKLIDYINENFEYKPKEGDTAYLPEELFQRKEGGAQDLSAFSAYVLYQQDFIPFIVRYHYISENGVTPGDNYVVEFRDTDMPKYIYFDKKGAHLVHHGWSFEELCQKEEERIGAKITKYGTISPLSTKLVPKEWVERK